MSYFQMAETKKKRVEAEEVLDEAKRVLKTAKEDAGQIRQEAQVVLSTAKEHSGAAIKESNTVLKNANAASEFAKSVSETVISDVDQTVDRINTALEEANQRIAVNEKQAKEQTNSILSEVNNLKGDVLSQLEILTQRNNLVALADKAILGDRNSLESLQELVNEDVSKTAVIAEILRVKSFYIGGSRIAGTEYKKNGEKIEPKDIETQVFAANLVNPNAAWKLRGQIAKTLSGRKEKVSLEAIVKCIKGDESLDVLKVCINSFEVITEYKSGDVLNPQKLLQWWEENKEETLAKLNDQ